MATVNGLRTRVEQMFTPGAGVEPARAARFTHVARRCFGARAPTGDDDTSAGDDDPFPWAPAAPESAALEVRAGAAVRQREAVLAALRTALASIERVRRACGGKLDAQLLNMARVKGAVLLLELRLATAECAHVALLARVQRLSLDAPGRAAAAAATAATDASAASGVLVAYVRAIGRDASWLPLPLGSDPLLLRWFTPAVGGLSLIHI